MKELRKYNDEINLDEILDIIKYRMIKDTTNATTLLILWYLYATKKKQCEYEHVDKKTNKKSVYNSVVDIVADYGIDKDKWKVFVENMNVLYTNMTIIKTLTVDGLTPFIKMLESSYCFAINSIGIEVDNKSIGFLYGYIIKASDISIRQVVEIKPALELDSIATYSVLYLSILKMIDSNAFLDQDEFPTITTEDKTDPKKEVEEEIVKNSTTVSTPAPEKPVVIEEAKKEEKEETKPSSRADNFAMKKYQEVDIKEIDFLDESKNYKSRYTKVKGQQIDVLEIYNNILSNTISIAKLAKKYKVTDQSIRNPINIFCEENSVPRPRQGVKAGEKPTIIKPIAPKKSRIITNDSFNSDNDEALFQRAQIQNAREINKINNSKSFFPSKIEGLKEEITGVSEQKRKFINRPVDKERGVDLFLNKEQKDHLKKFGEGWLVLNTGKPYYVTSDGRIWRNKPSVEDLKQYV